MKSNSNYDKVSRFMHFEHLLFRIDLFILGVALFILTFFLALIEQIRDLESTFEFLFFFGMFLPAVKFVISIIRVLKYYFKIRHEEGRMSIWRSGLSLLISPLSFAIFWFIFILLAFASCTVGA